MTIDFGEALTINNLHYFARLTHSLADCLSWPGNGTQVDHVELAEFREQNVGTALKWGAWAAGSVRFDDGK